MLEVVDDPRILPIKCPTVVSLERPGHIVRVASNDNDASCSCWRTNQTDADAGQLLWIFQPFTVDTQQSLGLSGGRSRMIPTGCDRWMAIPMVSPPTGCRGGCGTRFRAFYVNEGPVAECRRQPAKLVSSNPGAPL